MINDTGWICETFGIPIYPTLACTRSDSIQKWKNGQPDGRWEKMRRKGHARCVRVRLIEAPTQYLTRRAVLTVKEMLAAMKFKEACCLGRAGLVRCDECQTVFTGKWQHECPKCEHPPTNEGEQG